MLTRSKCAENVARARELLALAQLLQLTRSKLPAPRPTNSKHQSIHAHAAAAA
jgi:hypothetical protein